MGRRPEPVALHLLRGNPSRLSRAELERRREAEVKPPPALSTAPPEDLTRFELECWKAYAPELERAALFTVLDPITFRLAVCSPYAVAMEALERLRPAKADGSPDRRRRGLDVLVPDRKYGGIKRSPALSVFLQAVKEYRAGVALFGLAPLARVSLRSTGQPDDDPDDDLLA